MSTRFGAYEKVSQTTYTSTDAAGHEVKRIESVVGRRDTNGQVVVEQGSSERRVSPPPPPPPAPPAAPAPAK